MRRESALQGVAHDIAHHAASGVSPLSSHLALAMGAAGIQTVAIDLLEDPAHARELPEDPLHQIGRPRSGLVRPGGLPGSAADRTYKSQLAMRRSTEQCYSPPLSQNQAGS
jgi:hypothetical protein